MLRKEMKERITEEESRNPEPEAAGREVLPIQEKQKRSYDDNDDYIPPPAPKMR